MKLFGDLERLLVELQGLLPVPQAEVQIAQLVIDNCDLFGIVGRAWVTLKNLFAEPPRLIVETPALLRSFPRYF